MGMGLAAGKEFARGERAGEEFLRQRILREDISMYSFNMYRFFSNYSYSTLIKIIIVMYM